MAATNGDMSVALCAKIRELEAALQEEKERRVANDQRVQEKTREIMNKLKNNCTAEVQNLTEELQEARAQAEAAKQLVARLVELDWALLPGAACCCLLPAYLPAGVGKEAEAKAGLAVEATRQEAEARRQSRKEQDALQKELELLKADIASKAAGEEAKQQAANEMTAEVEQLQAACAAEAQRADAAETAAKASQEEAERMRFGEADTMKQAEDALAVLLQERDARQAELGQTEAVFDSQVATDEAIRADLEEASSAANTDKQALQELINVRQNDVSSRSGAADAEQQTLAALQEGLRAGGAAAKATAAELWQVIKPLRAGGPKRGEEGGKRETADTCRLAGGM